MAAEKKKVKHEIYDEKDKRLGRRILVIFKWVALVAAIIGPFVYMFNHSWGLDLGTLAVLCGGGYLCFGPRGRTAGGQWIALLETLGLAVVILVYFLVILKYIHF
ncbi:hypothetical protein [Lactiplantibacillus xiangfangensis]|uniref:Integral membrane protein n=1 Tax=Lactiplantibacillus xiangfangensis TaxID=942150 RepID=A0A0R2M174_9LACO|nr:hypothetical protein [Lactiplantibacillus xiangfangensis]KRO07657.1 hypothetical protein IV64_GL001595 [Lactiplantibacillus xiangfangensis]